MYTEYFTSTLQFKVTINKFEHSFERRKIYNRSLEYVKIIKRLQ